MKAVYEYDGEILMIADAQFWAEEGCFDDEGIQNPELYNAIESVLGSEDVESGWIVEDIDKTIKELENKGIELEEVEEI